jgi:uncharacterized protein
VLTDVPRIAPCLPGAELKESEGDEHKGVVKIKVGPITAQYSGVARFVEKDEAAGRAVLSAEGRDTRGAGNARATITATLTPDGEGTKVVVDTDLDITGRVAQFGRGVLADVSASLMAQFADCLSAQLTSEMPAPPEADAEPQPPAGPVTGRQDPDVVPSPAASQSEPEARPPAGAAPVDLIKVAGGAIGKRVVPALGGGSLALFLLWRGRRRRRRR